jgi:hypothetical protein
MLDIKAITDVARPPSEIITDLKKKTISVPSWATLVKEYDPKNHPVMDKHIYPDKVKKGKIEFVTRITLDFMKLAARRMTELCFGIPVKRLYKPEKDNADQKRVAEIMEKIFKRNRIDMINIERGNYLFAGCEVATLWYSILEDNNLYGEPSKLKLRCKNFSPMDGESLYPYFDEFDDMKAMSIAYSRTEADKTTEYFETYTEFEHLRWSGIGSTWAEDIRESITLGKISMIYGYRPTPIHEETANNVYEMEWALSRNGNYIRKNSKPNYNIFSDEKLELGKSKDDDFVSVHQYPANAKAEYSTWPQATDSLKFHVETLSRMFFTQLQLADMSYENMKSAPMSGEARKMMFLDSQLKVRDESGRWLEYFDREVNVIRAYMKVMYPKLAKAIDALTVENVITPFTIDDEKERAEILATATGNKAYLSQEEAVRKFGAVDNVDDEMKRLKDENTVDIMEPAV